MLGSPGCSVFHHTTSRYATVAADPSRDEAVAAAETKRTAPFIQRGNWERAEEVLQRALKADVTYGPAHNNLGHIYLKQRRLYLASWEFEYAIKLMPGRPEPYYNLGVVYEEANSLDRAVDYYSKACSIAPDNMQFVGNLARTLLKRNACDPSVATLLAQLSLNDARPEWVQWAREQLAVGKFPRRDDAVQPTAHALPPPPEQSIPEIVPAGESVVTDESDL